MQLEILSTADLERPLFWTSEGPIFGDQILRRASRLAGKLPDRSAASVHYERRDRFVTALLSLWMRGQTAVLPAEVVLRQIDVLKQEYPDLYFLAERPLDPHHASFLLIDDTSAEDQDTAALGTVQAELAALRIFTSGSTGQPASNIKSWELLSASANPTSALIGLDRLESPSIVATVPSYHMYGFELTVLAVLGAGAAVHCERAVYPADVARSLQDIPSPRVLVTTPFHLRALMESKIDLPAISQIVSATAPLAPEFAASIEDQFRAPVYEIYGFTEAGCVAARRTIEGDAWTLRRDLAIVDDNGTLLVEFKGFGVRVPFPDAIEILDPSHIRLRNRNQDVVNVAGKRASLAELTAQLTKIDGVEDGIFFLSSQDAGLGKISRLMAVVVSRSLTSEHIKRKLRDRIEPAFLPRHVFHVEVIPRNETGKITREILDKLIMSQLNGNGTLR
jgi:acyl-coenzyme A synthetase/AMP-(fatty) acid ligase